MQNDQPVTVTELPSTEPGEPAAISGALVTFVTVVISGGLFGLSLTSEQRSLALLVVALLAPLVTSLIIRFKVWSPKTVDQLTTYYKLLLAEQKAMTTSAQEQLSNQTTVVGAVRDLLPTLLPALGETMARALPASQSAPAPQSAPPPYSVPAVASYAPQQPAPAPPTPRQSDPRAPIEDPSRQQTAQPEGFYDYSSPPLPQGYSRVP